MDFDNIEDSLMSRGINPAEYKTTYNDLITRIVSAIKAKKTGDWGDATRIQEFKLVLRQILLHRAIKLFEGAIDALTNDNGYSMILSIRGHLETTAALGYLHNRLYSLQQGNLDAQTVDKDIATQILGTRDSTLIVRDHPEVSEAKQILTMLKIADKSVSKHIMQGTTNEYDILMDSYEYLCEFSHPNFHSNKLAFDLNKEKTKMSFRHNTKLRNRETNLIRYIHISNTIFIKLYDDIEKIYNN